MGMNSFDLIVVGGGPAGASAAITAAKTGATVLLLERGRFPRHKVCGEFVSAESLDLLSKLLSGHHGSLLADGIRIPRARMYLDGRMLESAIDPPAVSIARLDLDVALWDSALGAGVDARQESTVHTIIGNGPFRVVTSQTEFESRALINASGRWSNLSAVSSNRSRQEKWIGVKGHFAESSPQNSVDLYFFDGGYCGVQPVDLSLDDLDLNEENRMLASGLNKGGRVNACAMVRADVATTLPEVFSRNSDLLERTRNWTALSEPVSTSPLLFRDPQAERDGMLLAGDAAGFVDPFVGDGISLALRSGSLAARSVAPFFAEEISWPAAGRQYRHDYAEQLAPVFRASSKIRRLLVLPRAVRKPLLSFMESTPAVTRYVIRKTR